MDSVFGLIGGGGFTREVMPLFEEVNDRIFGTGGQIDKAYIVVSDGVPAPRKYKNVECITLDQFLNLNQDKFYNIALADSKKREDIELLIGDLAEPLEIRSPQARIGTENEIGKGAIFCDFSVVTTHAKIGKFFHANIKSCVEHDCEIGDYVTFSPGVMCSGRTKIGNNVFVGAGALLKDNITVGDNAIIGMGAVVLKDVPAGVTVVGNPAKILLR